MIGRFVGGLFGGGSNEPTPTAAPVDTLAQELDQIEASLEKLRSSIRRSGSRLPTVLSSQLLQLADAMEDALTEVRITGSSTEQRVLLNAMICSYVPEPLQSYLSLPPVHHEEGSKTSGMFEEQLSTLFETLADLTNQIRIGAVEELSTHGRFLNDKFASQDQQLQLEHNPDLYGDAPEGNPTERDPLRLEGQSWHQ